jgi:2-polyprenyl-6-methoxyphenol hydroxylase-like FAD-dependent oxidoreductase
VTDAPAEREGARRPETRTCCIAGCGPAGAVLGLLLTRAGVDVLVLEKHEDFFRDFRGDTIHPSTLDVIDELGLFDRFQEVPHERVPKLRAWTDRGSVEVADFSGLGVDHPYIAMVPQWDFLDFLTDAAAEHPGFELRLGAEVIDLVRSGNAVRGVRYRSAGGVHEVSATLTVAADGRHSDVRAEAGLDPVRYGAPMDVLWFRLSRRQSDPPESFGRLSAGRFMALINRSSYWQIGYVIPKGTDAELRRQSIDVLRSSLRELLPFLADRVDDEPASWDDVKTLEVQVDRLRRWHLPGLLCIGDAAHAMSPIGGVGINLAVQDAVAAANILAPPLRDGTLDERALARVRWRRWLPTALTQAAQRLIQQRVLAPVLQGGGGGRPPRVLRALARSRLLRRVPARLIGVGVLPEHVRVEAAPGQASSAAGGSAGERGMVGSAGA